MDAESLEYTIKEASPFGDYILEELAPQLEKDRIEIKGNDLSKLAGKRINPDNDLVEKVSEYHETCVRSLEAFADFIKKAQNLDKNNPIEKKAESSVQYIARQIKGLWDFSRNHPVISGMIGAYGVGKVHQSKNQQIQKN